MHFFNFILDFRFARTLSIFKEKASGCSICCAIPRDTSPTGVTFGISKHCLPTPRIATTALFPCISASQTLVWGNSDFQEPKLPLFIKETKGLLSPKIDIVLDLSLCLIISKRRDKRTKGQILFSFRQITLY